jgi:serine/threonine-protein kinase
MELLEGETLESLLVHGGRLALEPVTMLVGQVGRALAQAHAEGVFHRDLKPANVFLMRDEEGRLLAKLLDFGIARAIHAHRTQPSAFATAKGVVFGTPSYMSPEQARGSARLDHRCDLWALATIAYEALTGELPIEGTDTEQLIQNLCAGRIVPFRARSLELPDALDAFVARAFSEQIAERFQTAADFVQAFEAAAGVSAATRNMGASSEDRSLVESAPGSVLDRRLVSEASGPLRRRTRAQVAVLAAAAALLVSVVVGVAWRTLARPRSAAGSGAPIVHSAMAETAAPAVLAPPPVVGETSMQPEQSVPVSALPHAQSTRPAVRPQPRSGVAGHAHSSSIPVAPPPVSIQPPTKRIDKSEVF